MNSINKTDNASNTDFTCSVCGLHFSEEKQFYGHLRIHTGEVFWSCTQCSNSDVKFESQSRLRIHENTCHNINRPFKCQQCSLEFDRASQLAYHQRSVHLGEKSHICQICEKGFFRKTDLRTHLNIHLGTNICICEVCGRKFNHVSNLIRHCRIHAGIKPYPCTVCGKRFTQISSLVRHKRIHRKAQYETESVLDESQSRQYSTDIVSNLSKEHGITDKPQLQKIIKRKHYCKTCGESFKFIFLLRQHEKEHANNTNILQCQNYKKVFQKTEELKEHMCHDETRQNLKTKEIQSGNCLHQIDLSPNASNLILPVQNQNINSENLCNLQYTSIGNTSHEKNLESAFCITSEQFEQFNLEKMDDVEMRLPEERVLELMGNINSLEMPLDRVANVNIAEILNCNGEIEEFLNNDNAKLKVIECSKHRNCLDNATDVIYVQCLSKNDSPCKNDTSFDKNQSKVLKTDISKLTKPKETLEVSKECVVLERKKKSGEQSEDSAMVQCPLIDNITLDSSSNCKLTFQVNDNLPPVRDNSSDCQEALHFFPRSEEIESFECNNMIFDQDKSAMRLVQIETGQQFYELIMNSFSEKILSAPSPKIPEKEIEDAIIETNLDYDAQNRQVLQEFEFFRNGSQTTTESYDTAGFDSLQEDNYTEQFLTFEQSEKLQNDVQLVQSEEESEQFFGFVESTVGNPLQSNNLEENVDLEKNKSNESFESNALDFLICVIDNVKVQSDDHKFLQQASADENTNSIEKKRTDEMTKNQKKNNVKKFQCTVCDKTFSTGYNFKQHIGTHFSEQQNFHCKECGMSFAWKSTLNKHIANNHKSENRQMFVCDICPKVYNTLSQVNEHVKRDHLKERNHVCSQCGKSFFKKFDLKMHCRIHTNERPYVCRLCGKGFHHQSHIIRHKRIHSGEKPYMCDICQKSFSQKGSLNTHRQRHSREKLDIPDYNLDNDDPTVLNRL